MFLLWIILDQKKAEKKYGKENLACSMSDRLRAYFLCFGLPIIIIIIKEMIKR